MIGKLSNNFFTGSGIGSHDFDCDCAGCFSEGVAICVGCGALAMVD
jgi:hypothetical protein